MFLALVWVSTIADRNKKCKAIEMQLLRLDTSNINLEQLLTGGLRSPFHGNKNGDERKQQFQFSIG